jgi:hypothetical protein
MTPEELEQYLKIMEKYDVYSLQIKDNIIHKNNDIARSKDNKETPSPSKAVRGEEMESQIDYFSFNALK